MRLEARKIRVIIGDAQTSVRNDLRSALLPESDIHVIAECISGAEVVRAIQAYRPELVLLGVALADGKGTAVVEHIGPDRMPATVFLTHSEQDARSLDAHALDYLVTPVDDKKLGSLLDRVRSRLRHGAATDRSSERLADYLANSGSPTPRTDSHGADRLTRFMIRERERIRFIATEDVDWIEGARNYVRLHVGDRSYLIRGPLTAILAQLDPAMFTRIHRSIIVNVDRVADVQPWVGGDYTAILRSGERLRVSRNFRDAIVPSHVRA